MSLCFIFIRDFRIIFWKIFVKSLKDELIVFRVNPLIVWAWSYNTQGFGVNTKLITHLKIFCMLKGLFLHQVICNWWLGISIVKRERMSWYLIASKVSEGRIYKEGSFILILKEACDFVKLSLIGTNNKINDWQSWLQFWIPINPTTTSHFIQENIAE
jgi:hypothetical protein